MNKGIFLAVVLSLLSVLTLTGCETLEGFGEDVEDVGEEVDDAAE